MGRHGHRSLAVSGGYGGQKVLNMADQRVIAIFGATGAQGGGLARAILADPEERFSARVVTRDPGSPKALALGRLGAEVVTADLDDEQSVLRALEGAYAAFLITFFWHH